MELAGSGYLFNLSVLAVTFATVSVLVMLIRQMMGGKLTTFDVHLIASYISIGFALAVGAVLPPMIAFYEPSPRLLWTLASGLAAVLLGVTIAHSQTRRRKASGVAMPLGVKISYGLHWTAVALLVANAAAPAIQGIALFATALTLDLAVLFLAFVRRIASLFGEEVGGDWDPRRG